MSITLTKTFQDHFPWLVSRLTRRTGSHELAEEIAAEVFARIAHSSTVEAITQPRAFLTTASARVLIDMGRKTKLERNYLRMLEDMPADQRPTPEDEVRFRELLALVDTKIGYLPDKAKAAFIYFRIDHLSRKEISQRLGVSVSMVNKYIAQGDAACKGVV